MSPVTIPDSGDIAALLVIAVVTRLRVGGVPVSTSEVLDATHSLEHTDLRMRSQVRGALRATLVKDIAHETLFRRAFDAVFPRVPRNAPDMPASAANRDEASKKQDLLDSVVRALRDGKEERLDEALEKAIDQMGADQGDGRSARHHAQRLLRRMNLPDLYRRYMEAADDESSVEKSVTAAEARTAMEQLGRRLEDRLSERLREDNGVALQQPEDVQDRPLLRAGADELVAMRLTMRPLARRLATRLGAQRRRGGSGLDIRRTIRASMGTGGVPVTPMLRRRRLTKPDLIVLCDVSGSTAQFAPFTLTLLHAVHQEFRRVRSFVFIDGIVEITETLESSPGILDPHHLLSRGGLVVRDGRSDYARALTTFLATWGNAVTARTTLIIAGDARSHDRAPATSVIAELNHRARRLYWLNPEPKREWNTLDSRAGEYDAHCTATFEVSTIRQLTAAVTQIV